MLGHELIDTWALDKSNRHKLVKTGGILHVLKFFPSDALAMALHAKTHNKTHH